MPRVDESSFLRTIPEDASDADQLDLHLPSSAVQSEASSTRAIFASQEQYRDNSITSDGGAVVADDGDMPVRRRRAPRPVPSRGNNAYDDNDDKPCWCGQSRTCVVWLALGIGLAILVIVVVPLAIVFASGDPKNVATDTPVTAAAGDLSLAPTLAPDTVSTVDAILYAISDPALFDDPDSPQYKARQWLLQEDLVLLDALEAGHLGQRYIATEFLFAMVPEMYAPDYNFGSSDNERLSADTTECEWPGFRCPTDAAGHIMTRINMPSANLTGSLPEELSLLTSLQEISLPDNTIIGDIPQSIGALSQLYWLDLRSNRLSSTVPPQLFQLPVLRFLYLSDNLLSGDLPEPALTKGQRTYLFQALWLDHNQLSGTFPSWLFDRYEGLETVLLAKNQLTGELLAGVTSLPVNFTYLDVADNFLEGTIPSVLWEAAPSLEKLYLENNTFTGGVPNSATLSKLQYVWLYDNPLAGTIGNEFASQWPDLKELYIQFTDIRGNITDDLCQNWPALERLLADCLGSAVARPKVSCACCQECY